MAIEYSGGPNVNTTFTCTTGTRLEIVTGLSAALVSAGWTIISGGGTGNQLLESATTPSPQSLVMRVQLYDPGSGNCCNVIPRNQAGTNLMSTGFLPLLPIAGLVYQVIANPYQAFCFTASSMSNPREYVGFGVPYLPSFLQGVITECIWSQANAQSDTDTTLRNSLRTTLGDPGGGAQWPAFFFDVNGNLLQNYNFDLVGGGGSRYSGSFQLVAQLGSMFEWDNGVNWAYRWHDDSLLVYEPLVAWGLTGPSDEPKFRGQLWDAAIINSAFTADQTTSFDTRNWQVLTNTNIGGKGTDMSNTILLVIP